jgi:hypothetical protein
MTDFGPVVQLGERYNGIVEVRGSTPLRSTTLLARVTELADVPDSKSGGAQTP